VLPTVLALAWSRIGAICESAYCRHIWSAFIAPGEVGGGTIPGDGPIGPTQPASARETASAQAGPPVNGFIASSLSLQLSDRPR
jgi:hypothetical protein